MPSPAIDHSGIEERIGRILGILEPLPEHIGALFRKYEEESQERLAGDESLKSDVRSLRESLAALDTALKDLREEWKKCGQAHQNSDKETTSKYTQVESDLKDVLRVLKIEDGNSLLLGDLSQSVTTLTNSLSALQGTKQNLWAVAKGFFNNILAIIIALVIAYLILKLGLAPKT